MRHQELGMSKSRVGVGKKNNNMHCEGKVCLLRSSFLLGEILY